jgi:hypothetical protein
MVKGQRIRLIAYGGEEIIRRVVGETDSTVIVCTDAEYDSAEREGRDPKAVGFPKSTIVGQAFASPAQNNNWQRGVSNI